MAIIHKSLPLTNALLAGLQAAGLTVGDGEKPAGTGWQGTPGQSTFNGYLILYPFGGSLDGGLANPDEDADARYHIQANGATRQQCEHLQDAARVAMAAMTLTVAGRKVIQLRIDLLGGCARDDSVQPPLWIGFDRYACWTVPG